MFLASGAASLICQVIWFKQLQFVLGSSTFAVSVTEPYRDLRRLDSLNQATLACS